MEKAISGIEKVGKSIIVKVGSWAFLIGVLIAFIAGIVVGYGEYPSDSEEWAYIATALGILGFIVGIVSAFGLGTITKEEVSSFLIAAVAVVVVGLGSSIFESIKWIGPYIGGITRCFLMFVAPAAIIIALKALWDIGKEA